MLISKKTSEYLKNAFNSSFFGKRGIQEMIDEKTCPESIKSLKHAGFFKKVIIASKPILQANNRFIDNINKNKDIVFEWAKECEDFRRTILIDMYPYFIEKNGLDFYAICLNPDGTRFIGVKTTFKSKNEYGMPDSSFFWWGLKEPKGFADIEIILLNLHCLFVFLRYAEIEEKVIKAKSKEKKPKKEDRDVNLSDFDVSVLSSTYYTKIYVEGAIEVSGYFKLQPCGEGGKDRKLIEVKPYTRNGYTRRSDIELGKAM